ncbi:hypothetical protein CTAYLR_004261 [Chrysophaeum taylorii]|uniref:OTU domain-containing protein n=1 Tax=Chrysophaeum taylorii TaxID=2483200 RepID=A0AAD7UFC0_9STRA|nr:hypothetical protein CTAYLR_004261 [Chrysophaeum taylorii]
MTREVVRRLKNDPRQLDPEKIVKIPEKSVVDNHRDRLNRFLEELKVDECEVRVDGACQFRALAHQLLGDESKHNEIRAEVVEKLASEKEKYFGFVVGNFDNFLGRMMVSTEWGDHLTLKAAADVYQCRICIVTSYSTKPFVHVLPSGWADKQEDKEADDTTQRERDDLLLDCPTCHSLRTPPPSAPSDNKEAEDTRRERDDDLLQDRPAIWLSFWAEVHYNSLASYEVNGERLIIIEPLFQPQATKEDDERAHQKHVRHREAPNEIERAAFAADDSSFWPGIDTDAIDADLFALFDRHALEKPKAWKTDYSESLFKDETFPNYQRAFYLRDDVMHSATMTFRSLEYTGVYS